MSERLLIAVDDSEASTRAVRYIGRLFQGSTHTRFVLLNVVAPPSAKLTQSIGVDGTLGPLSSDVQTTTSRRGIAKYAEEEARPILEEALAELEGFGITEERIDNHWFVPGPRDDLEHGILGEAEKFGCGTIVVGRQALPWYREMFHSHVADKLAKHAKGVALWIVESDDERYDG